MYNVYMFYGLIAIMLIAIIYFIVKKLIDLSVSIQKLTTQNQDDLKTALTTLNYHSAKLVESIDKLKDNINHSLDLMVKASDSQNIVDQIQKQSEDLFHKIDEFQLKQTELNQSTENSIREIKDQITNDYQNMENNNCEIVKLFEDAVDAIKKQELTRIKMNKILNR